MFYKTSKIATKAKAARTGDINADTIMEGFDKETRIVGLTNWLFSLISLIRATLKKTGKAHVIISTWSAGFYDVNAINDLLMSGDLLSLKMILDRSFKTRQKGYAATVTDFFSPENIRTTDTHSKFVLIYNDEWNVCINSSMNLNENKRCENFTVENDKGIFDLFKVFADELFSKQQPGIIEDRKIIDPVFDSLFPDAPKAKKITAGNASGWQKSEW